jgi:hypothetical protein
MFNYQTSSPWCLWQIFCPQQHSWPQTCPSWLNSITINHLTNLYLIPSAFGREMILNSCKLEWHQFCESRIRFDLVYSNLTKWTWTPASPNWTWFEKIRIKFDLVYLNLTTSSSYLSVHLGTTIPNWEDIKQMIEKIKAKVREKEKKKMLMMKLGIDHTINWQT